MSTPTGVLVLSWMRYHGRSNDLAAALGGEAVFISVGRLGQRFAVLWRYPAQAWITWRVLRRRRPAALVVMAPPLPLLLIALCWRLRHGTPVVADAHTGAVVSPRSGAARRRFRLVARRGDGVVVTRPALASMLAGCRTLTLDDPPVVAPAPTADVARSDRPRVVYPCSWYDDEPIDDVLAAATALPDVEFVLTGRPHPHLRVPANVTLTGYVDTVTYWSLLRSADLVLALTTREHTMQRAGYEALAVGAPLVVSATAALTEWFGPAAVATDAGAAALATAISRALDRREELVAHGQDVRRLRAGEFASSLAVLRGWLRLQPELGQRRLDAAGPGETVADQPPGPLGDTVAQPRVVEGLRQRSGELGRGVPEQVVLARNGAEATDPERRRHDRHAGAEGVEDLEPGAAAVVDRHDHRRAAAPQLVEVRHEPELLQARMLGRRAATRDEHLVDRRRER